MDTIEIKFKVQNKDVIMELEVDPIDPSKVYSNKYHYKQHNGKMIEMKARTDQDELYDDIRTEISYLATSSFRTQDFFDAIAFAAVKHIDKNKRLVLQDLWSYINCCMIIMEATQDVFHNHIKSIEQVIDLRDTFESELTESLKQYIWINVPDPKNPMGQPVLRKFTDII